MVAAKRKEKKKEREGLRRQRGGCINTESVVVCRPASTKLRNVRLWRLVISCGNAGNSTALLLQRQQGARHEHAALKRYRRRVECARAHGKGLSNGPAAGSRVDVQRRHPCRRRHARLDLRPGRADLPSRLVKGKARDVWSVSLARLTGWSRGLSHRDTTKEEDMQGDYQGTAGWRARMEGGMQGR